MTLGLDAMETLAVAIGVLFVGAAVQSRMGFLRDNNIPIPVIGGLLFAALTTLLFLGFDQPVALDMAMREPMMLAFFTTIGLGADVRLLVRGGPRLLLFGVVCLVYLVASGWLNSWVAMAINCDLSSFSSFSRVNACNMPDSTFLRSLASWAVTRK